MYLKTGYIEPVVGVCDSSGFSAVPMSLLGISPSHRWGIHCMEAHGLRNRSFWSLCFGHARLLAFRGCPDLIGVVCISNHLLQ